MLISSQEEKTPKSCLLTNENKSIEKLKTRECCDEVTVGEKIKRRACGEKDALRECGLWSASRPDLVTLFTFTRNVNNSSKWKLDFNANKHTSSERSRDGIVAAKKKLLLQYLNKISI